MKISQAMRISVHRKLTDATSCADSATVVVGASLIGIAGTDTKSSVSEAGTGNQSRDKSSSETSTISIPPHDAIRLPGVHGYAQRSIVAGEALRVRIVLIHHTSCQFVNLEKRLMTVRAIMFLLRLMWSNRVCNPFIPARIFMLHKDFPATKI